MSYEENELLKLYQSAYTGRLFEKASSYLNERNTLLDEREKLYNTLLDIKEMCEINIECDNAVGRQIIREINKAIGGDK